MACRLAILWCPPPRTASDRVPPVRNRPADEPQHPPSSARSSLVSRIASRALVRVDYRRPGLVVRHHGPAVVCAGEEAGVRELLARDYVAPAATPASTPHPAAPLAPPELPAAVVQAASGQATMHLHVGLGHGRLGLRAVRRPLGPGANDGVDDPVVLAVHGFVRFLRRWWDFALYRFLTGMGVGGEWAAGVALVAEVMPARARPYALPCSRRCRPWATSPRRVGVDQSMDRSACKRSLGGVSGWRLLFLIGVLPAGLVVVIRRRLREPESWVQAKAACSRSPSADGPHRPLGDLRELFGDPRWRYHMLVGIVLSTAGVVALWGVSFWTPELIRNNVLQDLPLRNSISGHPSPCCCRTPPRFSGSTGSAC